MSIFGKECHVPDVPRAVCAVLGEAYTRHVKVEKPVDWWDVNCLLVQE